MDATQGWCITVTRVVYCIVLYLHFHLPPAQLSATSSAWCTAKAGLLLKARRALTPSILRVGMQIHWGPSLAGLVEGCLPPAFEAEHRSWPDDGLDLLQLVSGPTILGSVRCSNAPLLPAPGSGCHQLQGGQVHGALISRAQPLCSPCETHLRTQTVPSSPGFLNADMIRVDGPLSSCASMHHDTTLSSQRASTAST